MRERAWQRQVYENNAHRATLDAQRNGGERECLVAELLGCWVAGWKQPSCTARVLACLLNSQDERRARTPAVHDDTRQLSNYQLTNRR